MIPAMIGEERLVPAPWESGPLLSVIIIPLPVATSPEIDATSGVPRQIGAVPGRYGLPFWSVAQ